MAFVVTPFAPVPHANDARTATEGSVDYDARVEAVVNEHYDFVWRSLRRLGVDEPSADDAAQQVFVVYARRVAEVSAGKDKTFLFGVVLRVAHAARRARDKRAEVSDTGAFDTLAAVDANPEQLLDAHRARALLDSLLEAMPLDLRTVFVLYEIEELTMSEIASILELPNGTVASRLRRARDEFQALSRRARAQRAKGEQR